MLYAHSNSYDIKKEIEKNKLAIMPIGAVEAHGPHLPLATDSIIAQKLAETISKKTGGLLLPLMPYGQVWSLKDFPGSIHISRQSLYSVIYDIGESLYSQGFRVFVLINGHMGNNEALKEAARSLYEKYTDLTVMYLFYPGIREVLPKVRESKEAHPRYFHACEIETSIMLYIAEEYVNMDKAIKDIPVIPEEVDITPVRWGEFTESAVLGDATLATKEKGRIIIEEVIERTVSLIKNALNKKC